jgi:hypothetical protein
MPFPVYLTPTTASPPDAQVQADVRAAVAAEGGGIDKDGVTLRLADGAKIRLASDAEQFAVEQLSPSFCRIVFNAALRSNSTVDRGGADLSPLTMKGAHGVTRYGRMRTETIASPMALCARLQQDLDSWNRDMAEMQARGVVGPQQELLEPPADPGTEPRIDADASGVAARCQATLAKLGWKIVRSVVSLNPQYGVVWRADVTIPAYPRDLSRIMCWRGPGQTDPDSYAFEDRPLTMFDPAQSVAPLGPEDAAGGR